MRLVYVVVYVVHNGCESVVLTYGLTFICYLNLLKCTSPVVITIVYVQMFCGTYVYFVNANCTNNS